MRDRLSKERRSWNMSRIRGKDTTPERIVRSLLHRLGCRFRLNVRIPVTPKAGTARPAIRFIRPDIVLVKHRLAMFVHGCFWHRHRGCRNCTTPTHRRAWWLNKLEGNAARDKLQQRALRALGWRVIVVWECEIEKPGKLERLRTRLERVVSTATERKNRNHPNRR
jgi:DNA mismatch endonuclease, patch repair protein